MLSIHQAVLCSDIINDSRTGQLSYIKVIESVSAPTLPVVIKGACIGFLCSPLTPEPHATRIDLVYPDKTTINVKAFTVELSKPFHKVVIKISNLVFSMEGVHTLLFSCKNLSNWKSVASLPINVILTSQHADS